MRLSIHLPKLLWRTNFHVVPVTERSACLFINYGHNGLEKQNNFSGNSGHNSTKYNGPSAWQDTMPNRNPHTSPQDADLQPRRPNCSSVLGLTIQLCLQNHHIVVHIPCALRIAKIANGGLDVFIFHQLIASSSPHQVLHTVCPFSIHRYVLVLVLRMVNNDAATSQTNLLNSWRSCWCQHTQNVEESARMGSVTVAAHRGFIRECPIMVIGMVHFRAETCILFPWDKWILDRSSSAGSGRTIKVHVPRFPVTDLISGPSFILRGLCSRKYF